MPDEPSPRPSSTLSTALLVLCGPFVVWSGVIWVAMQLASPDVPDGQCEGIGWGCTLPPRDGLALFGIVAGFVVVPVTTIVLAVVAARATRDRAPRVVTMALGGAGALLAGFLLIAALAGV